MGLMGGTPGGTPAEMLVDEAAVKERQAEAAGQGRHLESVLWGSLGAVAKLDGYAIINVISQPAQRGLDATFHVRPCRCHPLRSFSSLKFCPGDSRRGYVLTNGQEERLCSLDKKRRSLLECICDLIRSCERKCFYPALKDAIVEAAAVAAASCPGWNFQHDVHAMAAARISATCTTIAPGASILDFHPPHDAAATATAAGREQLVRAFVFSCIQANGGLHSIRYGVGGGLALDDNKRAGDDGERIDIDDTGGGGIGAGIDIDSLASPMPALPPPSPTQHPIRFPTEDAAPSVSRPAASFAVEATVEAAVEAAVAAEATAQLSVHASRSATCTSDALDGGRRSCSGYDGVAVENHRQDELLFDTDADAVMGELPTEITNHAPACSGHEAGGGVDGSREPVIQCWQEFQQDQVGEAMLATMEDDTSIQSSQLEFDQDEVGGVMLATMEDDTSIQSNQLDSLGTDSWSFLDSLGDPSPFERGTELATVANDASGVTLGIGMVTERCGSPGVVSVERLGTATVMETDVDGDLGSNAMETDVDGDGSSNELTMGGDLTSASSSATANPRGRNESEASAGGGNTTTETRPSRNVINEAAEAITDADETNDASKRPNMDEHRLIELKTRQSLLENELRELSRYVDVLSSQQRELKRREMSDFDHRLYVVKKAHRTKANYDSSNDIALGRLPEYLGKSSSCSVNWDEDEDEDSDDNSDCEKKNDGTTNGELTDSSIHQIGENITEWIEKQGLDPSKMIVADAGANGNFVTTYLLNQCNFKAAVGWECSLSRVYRGIYDYKRIDKIHQRQHWRPPVAKKVALLHKDLMTLKTLDPIDVLYEFDEAFEPELALHLWELCKKSSSVKLVLSFKASKEKSYHGIASAAGFVVKRSIKVSKRGGGGGNTVYMYERQTPSSAPVELGRSEIDDYNDFFSDDVAVRERAYDELEQEVIRDMSCLRSGVRR